MKTIHWRVERWTFNGKTYVRPKDNRTKVRESAINYKIKTDLGLSRFLHSKKKYGQASAITLNLDGEIIDGNTRFGDSVKKKEKYLNVSIPNRLLSPKEVKEFTAMFDFAKAGEVDMERIEQDLGTTKEFFTQWGLMIPPSMKKKLGAMGVNASKPTVSSKKKGKEVEEDDGQRPEDSYEVTLFFTQESEGRFRKYERKLMEVLGTDDTTATVLKVMKAAYLKLKA